MLAVLSNVDAESIFSGIVLLALLVLLLTGKIRLEREITDRDKIIVVKDKTIDEQAKTINTLLIQAEITNALLTEVRNAALSKLSKEITDVANELGRDDDN